MKTSFWKKLGKGALYLAAILLTAIVLFYSVTSYLGRREWAATKKALEARGEKLSLADLIPPPIPDELNFFSAPSFAELADYDLVEGGGVITSQPRVPVESQKLTAVKTALGTPTKGRRNFALYDLTAAAAYYQAEGKVPASTKGQPPAGVVLEALEPARGVVDEIELYAERPGARFPIRYEDGVSAAMPHLNHFMTLARYLRLRAAAKMELSRGAEAARDVLLLLRLADSLKGETTLISVLVRFSVLGIANEALWEGIARGTWDDDQLALFEERLRGYELLAETQNGLRAERGQMLSVLETALQKGGLGKLLSLVSTVTTDGVAVGDSTGPFLITTLYPQGWAYSDLALIANVHQSWIDALSRRDDGLDPTDYEFKEVMQWNFPTKIKHLLSALTLPAVSSVVSKGASTQAGIDQARVALALERYRLANGDFPATLDPLVPKFIPALPTDVMTNQPLHYRRISADNFLLWSIGWDATDDTGKPADPKTKLGDWVWLRQPDGL